MSIIAAGEELTGKPVRVATNGSRAAISGALGSPAVEIEPKPLVHAHELLARLSSRIA